MEPAPLAAVPDPPKIEPVKMLTCDEPGCGRSFVGEHGLQVHKARSHKPGSPSTPSRAPSAPKRAPVAPLEPTTPGVILVIARIEDGKTVLHSGVFTSDVDADEAEGLLAALGHAPHRIPVPQEA